MAARGVFPKADMDLSSFLAIVAFWVSGIFTGVSLERHWLSKRKPTAKRATGERDERGVLIRTDN